MDSTDATRSVPPAPKPGPATVSVEMWRKDTAARNRVMAVFLVLFMLSGLVAVPLLGGDGPLQGVG